MASYYVNKNAQSNGDHEVHVTGCSHPADANNRLQLGFHVNCQSAVQEAKKTYSTANGCRHCCEPCHTS
jgi:hypothetical protein